MGPLEMQPLEIGTLEINAQNVWKRFGKKTVLKGIDLQIPRGSVVGLLGSNGSGKSTFLKCLLGLLKIDEGEITLGGDDYWDLSVETKSRLGYVPQEITMFGWMLARQMVGYTSAFYPRWDEALVEQLVELWDVPWDDRVGSLSAGQKQKLALVMALGHRPELLILDEPVGSLDPVSRREFLKSLVELTNDQQHTVLFSTHITSDLERIATHVAILRDGKVEYFKELDELKEQVKRLRITAPTDLPATLQVPGALRIEVEGCDALVAVAEIDDGLVESLRQQWNAQVTVEDLNLEEIYLEVHDA